MTPEERREKDRIAHNKRYVLMRETISANNLARYYKRKEENPEFHPRKVGRPRKVLPTPDPVATVEA